MSEVNYSKKQIQPLVEKYRINVEKNMVFKSIITMFNEQTPYQVWAIKSVFDNVVPLETIQQIKVWAENNQTEIKKLKKGNIISYKTTSDFETLNFEIQGLNMLKIVRDAINRFNTRQRKMMTDAIISPIKDGLSALENKNFKEWFDILHKMTTLISHRQDKLISTSSAIDDIDFLKEHIKSALEETYEWNKEDMLGFMARNASDCSVVYNQGDIVVIQVPSFKSSKALCGNGRTGWCLTREERYFKQYAIDQENATQYFLFDFSKPENHDLAHIGFTVCANKGITNAHSTKNNSLIGEGIKIQGEYVNIHVALNKAHVPTNVYTHLKELMFFRWDVESFLEFIGKNKRNFRVNYSKNNRVVVQVLNENAFSKLTSHTFLNDRAFTINNETKTYVFLDFNLDKDDEHSTILSYYVKDKYHFDTLARVVNGYSIDMNKTNYLSSIGITTDKYLNREAIDPKILLHKLIDEQSENEAINLILNEGDDFDVNYEFSQITPIFKAIGNKMFTLFETIIKHKNFDCSTCDGFGETLLQSLIYSVSPSGTSEDDVKINKMIEMILNSKSFDFNVQNINLDTALSIACEYPKHLWIVKRLLADPNVNVNIINDYNCGALGNALRRKNIEAVKLLGQRPDLVVREEDKELAFKNGIDLKQYIKPQPFTKTSVETIYSKTSDKFLAELFETVLSTKN